MSDGDSGRGRSSRLVRASQNCDLDGGDIGHMSRDNRNWIGNEGEEMGCVDIDVGVTWMLIRGLLR
jgi:hypothetical protein